MDHFRWYYLYPSLLGPQFRAQLSKQRRAARTEADLYRSQKSAEQLDRGAGYEEPVQGRQEEQTPQNKRNTKL